MMDKTKQNKAHTHTDKHNTGFCFLKKNKIYERKNDNNNNNDV